MAVVQPAHPVQVSAQPLKVVVVEDEGLYREMLATSLGKQPQVIVSGSYSNTDEALRDIPQQRPDAAVLDIDLPGSMDGVELGLALRQYLPALGVILLSNHAVPQILSSLPREQVSGWCYLLKRSVGDMTTLMRTIQAALAGMVSVDPALFNGLHAREGGPLDRLTKRQREVLELLAAGYSNAAIAETLVVTEKALEKHVSALYQQLGIHRQDPTLQPRVRAVLLYLEQTRTRWSAALTG